MNKPWDENNMLYRIKESKTSEYGTFDYVNVGTGSINAWSNNFKNSAIDIIQNNLYGKPISVESIENAILNVDLFNYGNTICRHVDVKQFFPEAGMAKLAVNNGLSNKGIIALKWDAEKAAARISKNNKKPNNNTGIQDQINDLADRVSKLEAILKNN